MSNETRTVQIERKNEWITSHFSDIKQGDIFRMFESDNGEKVVDAKGRSEFVAFSDAGMRDDGEWIINVGC